MKMAERVAAITPLAIMSILDNFGTWRLSSRYEELPVVAFNPKRPIWHAALKAKSFGSFILPANASPAIGVKSLVMGVVPTTQNGDMLGIVIGFVPYEIVDNNFKSFNKSGRQASVRSQDGSILYSSKHAADDPAWLTEGDPHGGPKNDGTFLVNYPKGGQVAIAVHTSVEQGLVYTAAQGLDPILEKVRENIAIFALIVALSLGVATVILVLWVRQREVAYLEMVAAHQARHEVLTALQRDSTTGMLNAEGLRYELERNVGASNSVAIFVIGINHLQKIVEPLSDVGKDLIREFAKRVRDCLGRRNNYCARTAIDEFCVVQCSGSLQELVQLLLLKLG